MFTAPSIEKFLIAYNPGPGTIIYKSPKPGEVDDLVLKPWRQIPVNRAYLGQPYFRRDMNAKKFTVTESEELPESDPLTLREDYATHMDPNQKAVALRMCSEEWNVQFAGIVNIADQISVNGQPAQGSRVTLAYIRDEHVTFLRAVLDLEQRWQKRAPVVKALKSALAKIEKLGKYAV